MLSRNAAEMAVAFRLGLVTQAEVVAWADGVIAELDDPPDAALDLALMRTAHAQDVLGQLSKMSDGVTAIESLPGALKRFTARLRENPTLGSHVARGLYDIYVESQYHVPEQFDPIAGFDDSYLLARNGTHGTEGDAYRSLLLFCEGFENAV